MELRAWFLDPPYCAVGERGLKPFRIVTELDHQPARLQSAEQIVKGGSERHPLALLESERHTGSVARKLDQDFAMTLGQLGKIIRLCGAEVFQRRQRFLYRSDQLPGAVEFSVLQSSPRLGIVERGCFALSKFFQLSAEARKIVREACAAGLRAGAAEQREFQRLDPVAPFALPAAETAERVFQERQQRWRLQGLCHRLRRE